MILSTVLLITISALKSRGGTQTQPVTAENRPLLCNFAKVYRLNDGSYLSVRSDWRVNSSAVDRLAIGKEVYVCDSAMNEAGQHFDKIYYSGPDAPCAAASPNGLDAQKTGDCRSGWVMERWVDIVSG